MPTIEDLRASISQMTDQELEASLLDIRKERRIKKGPAKTSTPQDTQAKAEKADVKTLLSSLSPEAKARLLQQLTGGKDGTQDDPKE
jgi:hypothetical protein